MEHDLGWAKPGRLGGNLIGQRIVVRGYFVNPSKGWPWLVADAKRDDEPLAMLEFGSRDKADTWMPQAGQAVLVRGESFMMPRAAAVDGMAPQGLSEEYPAIRVESIAPVR
jgi:hypothetical protein